MSDFIERYPPEDDPDDYWPDDPNDPEEQPHPERP